MTGTRDSADPRAPRDAVTIEQIQAAIAKSGYPLQFVVGNQLGSEFNVQPEWGYFDRNTQEMRAIDLLATQFLHEWDYPHSKRVYPRLTLLIECKRSDLPYVFFSGSVEPRGGQFPHVAGLRSESIKVRGDSVMDSRKIPLMTVLGLQSHAFLTHPGKCSTLSKCAFVKGGNVVLSGEDPYAGLIMPIRSAVEYYRETSNPHAAAQYFTPTLVIGVAVLDAPMFAATINEDGHTSVEPTKWQRLWRHEPLAGEINRNRGESSAIDIVHREFLGEYVEKHLLPFAQSFSERALRHEQVLATGSGRVPGLKDDRRNLESRLEPVRVRSAPGASRSTGHTHSWWDVGRALVIMIAEALWRKRKGGRTSRNPGA